MSSISDSPSAPPLPAPTMVPDRSLPRRNDADRSFGSRSATASQSSSRSTSIGLSSDIAANGSYSFSADTPPLTQASDMNVDQASGIEENQIRKRLREEGEDTAARLPEPVAGPSSLRKTHPESGRAAGKRRKLEREEEDVGVEMLADPQVGYSAYDFPGVGMEAGPDPGLNMQTLAAQRHRQSAQHGDELIDVDALPDDSLLAGLSTSQSSSRSLSDVLDTAGASSAAFASQPSGSQTNVISTAGPEPLSAHCCPICFSSPTYATLTPCGHVLCGECLFTAVKTTLQRTMLHPVQAHQAKCPVCRAPIPGWDGRGGGVIGLQPRVVHSLDEVRKSSP